MKKSAGEQGRKAAGQVGGEEPEKGEEDTRRHLSNDAGLEYFQATHMSKSLLKSRLRNLGEIESDKRQEIVSEIPAEPRGSCGRKRLRAHSLHSHTPALRCHKPRRARLTSLSRGHCAGFEDSFET